MRVPVRCTNIIPEKYCRERERRGREREGEEERRRGRDTFRKNFIVPYSEPNALATPPPPLRCFQRVVLTRIVGRSRVPTNQKVHFLGPDPVSYEFDVSLARPAEQHVYIPTDLYAGTRKRAILDLRRCIRGYVEFECESEKCQSVYRNRWIVDRKKKKKKRFKFLT